MGPGRIGKWMWLAAALLCAAGTWIYAGRVLIPHQVREAAAHGWPRGNFSDLYPRWLGARELLLRGRDPYSAEVTREIQAGYYGRPLDRGRADEPRDEQGFAYPVYVVFLLAPTVREPFGIVQKVFFEILLMLTGGSVVVWLRALGWKAPPLIQATAMVLTLGSLAAMQGLKLQQMSLLVAGLLAMAVVLLMRERQLVGGFVLAIAAIKPQLVVLLLLWLAVWTWGDVRGRYRWAVSFAVTLAAMVAASEWLLPHWLPRFLQAAGEYRDYADARSVMEAMLGATWGRLLGLGALVFLLRICWRNRRVAANSNAFAITTSIVLAVTVLLVPKYAAYNQVLLVPALLAVARNGRAIWREGLVQRVLVSVVAVLVSWPWITCLVLAVVSFAWPREAVERAWLVPLWTLVAIPVGVAALMLVEADRLSFGESGGFRPS